MYEINFLPEFIKIKKIKKHLLFKKIIALVIAILIIIIGFYLPVKIAKQLIIRKNILQKQYPVAINKKVTLELQFQKRIKLLNSINMQKQKIADNIKDIKSYLTNEIVIESIKNDNNGVTITGKSSEYFSISNTAINMQKSKKYKNVKIINIERLKNTDMYSFLIYVKLKLKLKP